MARLAGAGALFVCLWLAEAIAGDAFPALVSIALVGAPAIQYLAYRRLRERHLLDPTIQSLRSAMFTALAMLVVSTALAAVGLIVVLRAFGWFPPLGRDTFLVLLAFPLLLLVAPAIEWLRLKVWPVAEAEAPS